MKERKERKIYIVKTDGKVLIGEGSVSKGNVKLMVPFEIQRNDEGTKIMPYDIEYIDTYIPYMTISEYEYVVEPIKQLADFYINSSDILIQEIKNREAAAETTEGE